MFAGGGSLENMPTAELTAEDFTDGKIDLIGVLVKSGLNPSRSEARRAIEQGGVTVNDEKITDIKKEFTPEDFGEGMIVRRGKKNYKKVVVK